MYLRRLFEIPPVDGSADWVTNEDTTADDVAAEQEILLFSDSKNNVDETNT